MTQVTPGMRPTDPEPDGRYFTIHDAAAFTGLSRASLYRRISDRTIPFIKIGRRVLFDRQDLIRWLATHKHKPR